MKRLNEFQINESYKIMDNKKVFSIVKDLEKDDKIGIEFSYKASLGSGPTTKLELVVIKDKTLLRNSSFYNKKTERIELINPGNPDSVNYYLDDEDGIIHFQTEGGSKLEIVDIKKIK